MISVLSELWANCKTNYGNPASVIGLLLTYIVYRKVNNLQRYYLFVGRGPELLERLREHSRQLTECLSDFTGSQDRVMKEIKLPHATLEVLAGMMNKQQIGPVKRLMNTARKYGIRQDGEEGLRSIHDDVLVVVQRVSDAQESLKWQRQ